MNPATLVGHGVRVLSSPESGLKVPCISAQGLVFTAWQPTPEEIEDLVRGNYVWVVQRGPFIPEMSLRVGKEQDVIPSHIRARAVQEALPDDPHEKAVKDWKAQQVTEQDRFFGKVLLAILAFVLLYGGYALWRCL